MSFNSGQLQNSGYLQNNTVNGEVPISINRVIISKIVDYFVKNDLHLELELDSGKVFMFTFFLDILTIHRS